MLKFVHKIYLRLALILEILTPQNMLCYGTYLATNSLCIYSYTILPGFIVM